MKTTIIGLFLSGEEAKKSAMILKKSGFKNMMIHCKESTSFLEKILPFINKLGDQLFKKNRENYDEKNYVTGIFSNNEEKLEKARYILKETGASQVYSFENMTKKEASSKEFLMRIIRLRSNRETRQTTSFHNRNSRQKITFIT